MAGLDLRPLSIGEILDRTFSLYRRYFVLFVGISAIPQIVVLGLRLGQTMYVPQPVTLMTGVWISLAIAGVSLIAYLLSQGATVLAVSELYLGRRTTIGESFERVWREFGSIFGVIILNGLIVFFGLLLCVVPGVYMACRLMVCVPAAMIEKRGARESLERSFELTRDFVLPAFLILVLSVILSWAVQLLLSAPFLVLAGLSLRDPSALRLWTACSQVGATMGTILIGPIALIASAVYYYDLRVRKEAFDLQIMMNPDSQDTPRMGPPSILS